MWFSGVRSPARNSPLQPALRRLVPQGFPILEETGHGCPVNQGRRSIKVPAFQAASEPAHKDLPDISVLHIETDVLIRTPCEIVHCGNLIACGLVSTKQTLKRITLAVLIPDEAATVTRLTAVCRVDLLMKGTSLQCLKFCSVLDCSFDPG